MPYTPSDIISDPIGTLPTIPVQSTGMFSPGAAFVIKQNADIINATWNLAGSKYYDYEAKISSLTDLTTGWLATLSMPHVTAGTVTAPTPTEPSMTIADTAPGAVYADFATQAGNIITTLVNKFSTFQSTWFPNEPSTYGAAEAWVYDAISNTSTSAVPATIKAAILASADASIVADKTRALADATETWAGKRHALPPGALTYATLQIEQKSLDAQAEAARSTMIKDFEQTYDKIMSAVKMALQNRATALRAAQDYIVAMVQAEGVGEQITGVAYEAQTRMINAAAGFFSQRITAADLALKLSHSAKSLTLEADKANQAADIKPIEFRLEALLSEIKALATMVTALMNNVRAGGSSSYNVSI